MCECILFIYEMNLFHMFQMVNDLVYEMIQIGSLFDVSIWIYVTQYPERNGKTKDKVFVTDTP